MLNTIWRSLVAAGLLLIASPVWAQAPINVAQVNGSTPDLATQTTLSAIETALSNPLTVTGTVALSNASAQLDDNVIAFNETRITVNAVMYCGSTSNSIRCPAGAGGNGAVDATVSRVVEANDSPVYLALSALNTQLVAHDAADAGNPLKVGAKATSSIIGQTPVANNDRTNLFAGLDGVQIVRPHANLEDRIVGDVAITDGSSTALGGGFAAAGSGVRVCATTLIIGNSSATNLDVDIRDGAGGSVLLNNVPAAANQGGAVIPLSTPVCSSANTALAADPSTSASTVTVNAIGFKTEL